MELIYANQSLSPYLQRYEMPGADCACTEQIEKVNEIGIFTILEFATYLINSLCFISFFFESCIERCKPGCKDRIQNIFFFVCFPTVFFQLARCYSIFTSGILG